MSDLISREVLVEKTEILYQHTESGKIIPWAAVRVCEINNIPTVEAEPVRHGRWVEPGYVYFGAKRFECSLCKDDEYWRERYCNLKEHYCPNCGAKMDGGAE